MADRLSEVSTVDAKDDTRRVLNAKGQASFTRAFADAIFEFVGEDDDTYLERSIDVNGKGGVGVDTRDVVERVTGPKSSIRKLLESGGFDNASLGDALGKVAGFEDSKEVDEIVDQIKESVKKHVGLEDAPVRTAFGKGLSIVFKTLEKLETLAETAALRIPYGAGVVVDGLYERFKNSDYGVGKFHELVVQKVFELTGLFEEGTLRAVQNNSDQGIDLIGKAATGKYKDEWLGLELKASGHGIAKPLTTDQNAGPDDYMRKRLAQAIKGGARWVPGKSAPEKLNDFAQMVLYEQGIKPFSGFVIKSDHLYDKTVKTTITEWTSTVKPAVNIPAQPSNSRPKPGGRK